MGQPTECAGYLAGTRRGSCRCRARCARGGRARQLDVVIADTAGRLHTAAGLMDELAKIRRVVGRFDADAPHETLLVLDASQGQNALAQATEFHARTTGDAVSC